MVYIFTNVSGLCLIGWGALFVSSGVELVVYPLIQEPSHNANNQWLSVYCQVARSPYPKPPSTVGTIIRSCSGEAQDWASRKTELLTTSRVGPSRPGTSSWARLCKEALCTMPALRIYRGLQSPALSISQSSWAQLCTDNSKNNNKNDDKTTPKKLRATDYRDGGTANGNCAFWDGGAVLIMCPLRAWPLLISSNKHSIEAHGRAR